MGTLSLQYTGAQTISRSATVTDADVTRLLNAERSIRNLPAATNAQIFTLVAQDFFNFLKMRTRQVEQHVTVQDITIT